MRRAFMSRRFRLPFVLPQYYAYPLRIFIVQKNNWQTCYWSPIVLMLHSYSRRITLSMRLSTKAEGDRPICDIAPVLQKSAQPLRAASGLTASLLVGR